MDQLFPIRHEFYDFQPKDWMTIKAESKELIRRLIALDMNVIVTARQKVQYADGGFMRAIGETFDGEKSLPYLFDVVVRLYRDEKGRFMGECQKPPRMISYFLRQALAQTTAQEATSVA